MIYFFDKILCNPEKIDYRTMKEQAYKCFEIYFRYINNQAQKIFLGTTDEKFKVWDSDLSGLKCLWEILLKTDDQVILQNAIELFSTCHLKYTDYIIMEKTQRQYQEKMTLECIDQIKLGYKNKNINLIKRMV